MRDRIEQVWRRLAPDVPFDGEFSEDDRGELYDAEEARAKIFAGFAVLAVIVACLGLFGLAAFTAERRTKEIGIRKVLGARTRDIVRLLAWQFSKPVIIANLIAWPVAWWVMRDWLNTFDARIDLGPAPFVLAGAARAGDRDRHHRRPRLPGRPRQSDPRAEIRMKDEGTAEGGEAVMWRNYLTVGFRALVREPDLCVHQHLRPGGRPRRLPDAAALRPLRDELRRWLPDADRVFQVQSIPTSDSSGARIPQQGAHGVLGRGAAAELSRRSRRRPGSTSERLVFQVERRGALSHRRCMTDANLLRNPRAAVPARRSGDRARAARKAWC